MIFTIHKEKLKDGLDKIRSSLSSGATNILLEHFLFEIKDRKLVVKATNISTSSIWETQVESEGSFSFTVPGSNFCSLVSSLENGNISFSYDINQKKITLKCAKYTWESISGDINNFPNLILPEEFKEYDLPQNFNHFLRKVAISISKDTAKPDLNSLCIDINKEGDNKIKLISTDKYRLSCASLSFEGIKEFKQIVIPKESVSEIIKLNPRSFFYSDDGNSIFFRHESPSSKFTFKTLTTSAKYPDIYAYLNNEFNQSNLKIKRSELISALKRIKIVTDKLEKVGSVEFLENKMVISTESSNSKAKEEVIFKYEGSDLLEPFKVKIDLLLDYLGEEEREHIYFKLIKKMCLVFDDVDYRHVLAIE